MRLLSKAMAASCLVLALAATASAQTMQAGIKGGYVRPTFGGKDATGSESMSTFGGGAFLSAQLSPTFAVQPELLYAPRGSQNTETGTTIKLKLNYIQVPVLLKFLIPMENASVKPALFAGPYVGFRSGCKAEAAGLSVDCGTEADSIKKMDYGATFGGGVEIPFGKVSGLVEARYDFGLTSWDDSSNGGDIKNRALSIFVGVAFPLGKGKAEASRTR